ncbi:MAG: peroxiredoxin family protein, partial [Chloroflexi bacterium]
MIRRVVVLCPCRAGVSVVSPDLPFPMLADPDASVIAAYGVYQENEQRARPAAFVIGRDLSIAYRYIRTRLADRPLTKELLEALATVQDASRRALHPVPLPRGPRSPIDTGRTPFPLEHLAPDMRGVNFAVEAISERVAEDERLQKEAATYRAIAQDYM